MKLRDAHQQLYEKKSHTSSWHTGKVRPRTLRWDSGPRTDVFKTDALKQFAIFTGKHMCWNVLLINETPTQLFSCEFSEISKNTFFNKTPLVAASYRAMFSIFWCNTK